jgi:hypothetical protein
MNLKKIGKVFTSKFVGTGPSSYKNKNLPGRGLTKVEKRCSKVQCCLYGTRPYNTKITPLDPQCIYSFHLIILIHPHHQSKRLSRTGHCRLFVESVQYTTRPRGRLPVGSLHFSVTYSFRPHHGPGVDSAPSENKYQEHFLGVKAAGA